MSPFLWTPKFVIVGTGRCGSGFIASLLTAGGIRTGHEGWWNPRDYREPFLRGDASWCAAFELDDYQGRILHQIRNPLHTLRSFAAVEVASHRWNNPWFQYRTRFVGFTRDPLVDSLRAVDCWLEQSERIAEWTWRVEDLDTDLVEAIADRLDMRIDRTRVDQAFPTAHRNRKWGAKRDFYGFDWDDLPSCPEKDRILTLADRYGYET